MTVQLAGQFRKDLGDGLCRSSGGWDQLLAAGTSPAQVLVACVDDGLGVGNVMDGGHATMHDTDLLVYYLDYGRQTVGGAGGRCQQVVLGRIVQVVIDTVDDIQRALGRCRHDDLLHLLVEIGLQRLRLLMVFSGRLNHDVATRPVSFVDGRITGCRRPAGHQ